MHHSIQGDSFIKGGTNTKFSYFYRDADNYKQHEVIVLSGAMTLEQAATITSKLDEDDGFVPSAVGLQDLQEHMVNGWDPQVDHPYHEIDEISLTDLKSTTEMTVAELVERFASADWEKEATRVSLEHS